jgi:hypothetical protein
MLSDLKELTKAIEEATRHAFTELLERHPEHFYYFSLITTGEGHSPVVAAWSREALEKAVANSADIEDAVWGLKWSYADSPYYCFGEKHFQKVNDLFAARPKMSELVGQERVKEFTWRMQAMEKAMANLNSAGLFGTGQIRNAIVINVEVMPPDSTNTDRARRLNPIDALTDWLAECAET